MKKIFTIIFIVSIHFLSVLYAQDNAISRLNTIKNRIQLLKPEIPGLNETLNVNISSTSLANFLLAVSKIHKVNINVSQELKNTNITNGFTDVTVGDLIVFLVKEYNLEVDFTGNILSIRSYKKPIVPPAVKEIGVSYNPQNNLLNLDLSEDPLDKVFRKIMSESGKNLLYSPSLNTKKLSAFIQKVPFETALDKLSISNGLEFEKTEDGFYIFNTLLGNEADDSPTANRSNRSKNKVSRIRPKRKKSSFFYEVLDYDQRLISIDVEDVPISDLVYTLVDEFDLDIFLASPLKNTGKTTIKSESIGFDTLLTKVFENSGTASTNGRAGSSGRGYYTFKKEKELYYFGISGQLTVNSIQFIPLQYRSIELLGDPTNNGGSSSRFSGNFNNNSGINFLGNGLNNGANQGSFNNSNSFNESSSSSNFQNNRNSINSNSGFNRRNTFSDNSSTQSSGTQSAGAITSLFPDNVLEGLDIKMDVELNGFIVSGPGTNVEKFKNFITYIDKPVPVILLDVMILEVSKTATLDAGLELGVGTEATQNSGVAFPGTNGRVSGAGFDKIVKNEDFKKIIGGFKGFSSLNLGRLGPNFYVDLRAQETNGNLKILSTPKLSTLNGHKAYLSSGETTYYQVVNQSFIGSQNPSSTEITNYLPIDAELAIEFKPYVAGNGQITLDIQVIQSSFGTRIDENAPPDINSRRFSSIIRMHENDVAILGGLEDKIKSEAGTGIPLLSKIPVLKWLFSRRTRTDSKSKLNILIKPTVFY